MAGIPHYTYTKGRASLITLILEGGSAHYTYTGGWAALIILILEGGHPSLYLYWGEATNSLLSTSQMSPRTVSPKKSNICFKTYIVCPMSCVMCHVHHLSCVTCQVSHHIFSLSFLLFEKLVDLVGGESVIYGGNPV